MGIINQETNIVNRTKTLSKSHLEGGWLFGHLQDMEELNLWPPKTNPFGGREEDVNLEPPGCWQSCAITTWLCCLKMKQSPAVLSSWPDVDFTYLAFFNITNQVKTSLSFLCLCFSCFGFFLGVWKVEIWQGVRGNMIFQRQKAKT